MDMQMEMLPKSALSYYVQLYCKKRKIKQHEDSKINVLAEATRSWLNLSASKKRIFLMKYNNCHLKLRKRFADKLRNAIPFPNERNDLAENTIDLNNSTLQNDVASEDRHEKDLQDETFVNQNSGLLSTSVNTEKEISTNKEQNLSKSFNQVIVEPIPPAFRTSQELYYIIKKNAEEVIPWHELTNAQRGPYITTAGRIKRLYLMEYTNYIESLSDKDLLAHYKNKIENS